MSEKWERRQERKDNRQKRRIVQKERDTRKKIEKAERRRHTVAAKLRRIYIWGAPS